MMRSLTAIVVACGVLMLPLSALAEKPDHTGGKGRKAHKVQGQSVITGAGKTRDRVRVRSAPVKVVAGPGAACPPGLAAKRPACVPPGQARADLVGRVVDRDRLHVITRPGLYGLGDPPTGQRYGVVDGRLVRVDSDTGRVLSILRLVDEILD